MHELILTDDELNVLDTLVGRAIGQGIMNDSEDYPNATEILEDIKEKINDA